MMNNNNLKLDIEAIDKGTMQNKTKNSFWKNNKISDWKLNKKKIKK